VTPPPAEPRPVEPVPAPQQASEPLRGDVALRFVEPPAEAPGAEAVVAEAPAAELARPRLKLTPTASDAEFKAVFDTATGSAAVAPAASDTDWTWKELLTSIDTEAGPDAERGQALFMDIQGMGIDPAALLSRARIDEIAAAMQTRDFDGGREVVRTLAPAAIRRLSRRLTSDAAFRAKTQAFSARYAEVVEEAMRGDAQGFKAASLLGSDIGRAYLLLDAASTPG
jgi:hypothetical protein